MRNLLGLVFWMMMSLSVLAVGVDEKHLEDPAAEARAQEVMKQLRCLVCQNQSIVDSDAGLAKDLRVIVRERILAGDDDQEILEYMTDRYGDWVLLKPPFDGATIILWISPFLLLIMGFLIIYRNQRASKKLATSAPLSADEEAQLKALLNDEGER